jgi:diguanylate cyclase (GGDEF)-like protein
MEDKRLAESEEYTQIMLDAGPLCCQLWDRRCNIVGCNEAAVSLFGFSSKEEFRDRWFSDCSPLLQPDGSESRAAAMAYIKRAFEGDGRVVFEWLHQTCDGVSLPSEITLVRLKYRGDYIVAGYTRDLRDITTLQKIVQEIDIDALTGLYNRRYLDKELPAQIKSLSRWPNGRLSVLMIDIDHFKEYNDTYGHSEGDKCLKMVADVIVSCISRETDFAVRYGGEEFTVVLPNTDERGARKISEDMLFRMRKANIPHKTSAVVDHVTFSIGATSAPVSHAQSADDYIRRADEQLYKSKAGGRDRYTFAALL